jgi:integrase/recombinase XerD
VKAPVVRLKIRVRLSDGSRPFLDPVPAPKGRLKPLCAIVNGTPEHHPEGVYFLRYAKNNKRVWEAVGDDAQIALDAKRRKERVLAAIAAGVTVVENDSAEEASPKPEKAPAAEAGTLLSDAIGEYLTEVGLQKAPATYVAYEHTLRLFRTSCKDGQQLEQLERKDLLAFMAKLKTDGKEARTVANHISFLKVFFRRYGVAWPLLKTDKVKYTQKVISAYSKDELRKLLEVADTDEADLIHFFFATGARDLEVVYATWPDVSFTEKSFSIAEKNDAELRWKPKDGEEGVIPIPDSLVALLKRRRLRYPKTRLIFPAENGGPDLHMLRIVKRLALRAKLNCGHCTNKKGQRCDKHAVCDRFGLHKFRKTFASMHHEAAVSVRTIQRWLRHPTWTTLRYLAAADDRSEKTRGLVNSTFAGIGGAQ